MCSSVVLWIQPCCQEQEVTNFPLGLQGLRTKAYQFAFFALNLPSLASSLPFAFFSSNRNLLTTRQACLVYVSLSRCNTHTVLICVVAASSYSVWSGGFMALLEQKILEKWRSGMTAKASRRGSYRNVLVE